ncbi:hypothetical protein ACFSTA_01685 [Ornithinibacillus salinisoli]|uniref:Uncharacterized protein n=1 Tax=Ornithinibacillus salinisoli TaxID=1848459 RepID=A0ABW4VV36_9BACI
MFEWLTEIKKPQLPFHIDNGKLKIEKVESEISLSNMSEVCQFFASVDVIIGSDGLTILPTPTEYSFHTIMNEIVPHYLDVKKIFMNGKLKEINVSCLKEESKKIVEDLFPNNVYPVIPDLYRSNNLNIATKPRALKNYLVNQELIKPLHLKETENIREFFMSSFFAENGSIMLQPTGWKLDDDLKESITIRTFSTFAKRIVLLVDETDQSVVSLEIYG